MIKPQTDGIEVNRVVSRAQPCESSADQASEDEVRRSLLQRSGLLEPGSRPELDRWTAVLRRATGSAVAALAVDLGDRTLVTGLWIGEAEQP